MPTGSRLRSRLLLLLLSLSVVACGTQGLTGPTSPAPTATVPASPSPVPATATPTISPPPNPSPTATDATTPQPSIPLPEPGDPPPLAILRTTDGAPIEARQGSWCYGDSCADVIVGPIELLPLIILDGPGAQLELSLPAPHRFVYWRVRYREAADDYLGTVLAEGGTRYPDTDHPPPSPAPVIVELESATFAGPPSGSWVLVVQLSLAPELGDATYYWHASVP